jgi:hypothetical protein
MNGDKLGEGDPVRLKRTGEMACVVHAFSVHPLKGDIVALVGKRREVCSVEEVDKVDA